MPACRSHSVAPRGATVSSADTVTHYVVVREDLPQGLKLAQVIHAAGESSPGNVKSGTFAVCLTVKSERALVKLADDLRQAGVDFVLVFEPDAPWNGAAMSLGVRPRRKGDLRRHLSALPLAK